MRSPGVTLPDRFHPSATQSQNLTRFLPRRLGSILVVLAAVGLVGFDSRSIWIQLAICWVLFSAAIRGIGFLIGYNSVR